MILTLSTPTEAYARTMSAALWVLACPYAGSATAYAVPWIAHPESADVALWLGGYDQRVHAEADIAAFVAALPITEDEATTLTSVLESARGGEPLTVVDWLPASLAANLLTDAEAEAAGWFDSDI